MALTHAHSGQLIRLHPLGEALPDTPSHALFKGRRLELMRLVLPRGRTAPPHQLDRETTVLCLEGRVQVDIGGRAQTLGPGDLVWLEDGIHHALTALEDSSVLVTVAL